MYISFPWNPSPSARVHGAGAVFSRRLVKSSTWSPTPPPAFEPGFSGRWLNLNSFTEGLRSFAISWIAGTKYIQYTKLHKSSIQKALVLKVILQNNIGIVTNWHLPPSNHKAKDKYRSRSGIEPGPSAHQTHKPLRRLIGPIIYLSFISCNCNDNIHR